jgi:hypothetical protein
LLSFDLVKNVRGNDYWLGKAKSKAGETPQVRQKSKTQGETPLRANIDERYRLGYQNWNGFLVLFLFGTKIGFFGKKKKKDQNQTRR